MTDKQKGIIAIIVFAVLCIVGGVIIYASHEHNEYLKAKGASAALTAQLSESKKLADIAIAAKNEEIALGIKQRDAAIKRATAAESKESVAIAKYDALKRETAALPAEALSSNINARIGSGNSWPTAGGLFSFTRPGAERTLNIFLDAENYKGLWEDEQVVSSELRTALSSAVTIGMGWEEKFNIKSDEIGKTVAAWNADKDALKHLERSIYGQNVKAFVIGTAVGVVAGVLVYNQLMKKKK